MRGLMLILSVSVVLMIAEASSFGSGKSWAERVESNIRLAELYKNINAVEEAAEKKSSGSNLWKGVDHRGQYTLFQNRMYNFFDRLDYNSDGKISDDDLRAIMTILDKVENLDPDRAKIVNVCLIVCWEGHFKDISGSVDDFTIGIENKMAHDNFDFFANGVFPAFHIAIDANVNGRLEWEEYNPVYNALFHNTAFSLASFAAADTDHDTVLSVCEYTDYAKRYFVPTIPIDDSEYFWGEVLQRPE